MEAAIDREPAPADPFEPRALGSGQRLDRGELLDAPVRWPNPAILAAPLTNLRGAGPKLSEAAAEIGIADLGDLLRHIPHGYRDRSSPVGLGELKLGEEATVQVRVVKAGRARPTRRRRLTVLEAEVADDSGTAKAVWFNRGWLADKLTPGAALLLRGKLEKRGFTVAEHELLGGPAGAAPRAAPIGLHTTGLVPIHPASERLRPQRIREWAWQARPLATQAADPLPARLRIEMGLASGPDALVASHFPETERDAGRARRRLAFEELFLYQAALAARRSRRRSSRSARPLPSAGERVRTWLDSLPFELTADQRKALDEIDADLAAESPMQRLLMGEVGSGKAQPLDSLVLTPSGYRRMGDLEIGEEIINPTGETACVTGVFPQGVREVWRLTFSDGSEVECDAEHLWQVQTSTARCRGDRPKVMTAREIADDLRRPSGAAKWHVELPEPADLEGGEARPLDPYLVGLLLGDGGLSLPDRVRFTTADAELLEAFREALPDGCELRRESHRPYDWKVVNATPDLDAVLAGIRGDDPVSLARAYAAGASHESIARRVEFSAGTVRRRLIDLGIEMRPPSRPPSPLAIELASLGLMGKGARDKAIPPSYLTAPIRDRHALLQGLMDTDGTLARDGNNVTFASTSRELAQGVAWLVRSLGGRARCRYRQKRVGSHWHTSVILPARFPPFRLARKADRLRPRSKYAHPAKAIVDIARVGRKPVRCISVSHPNQLYVTDGFTVTHNTVVSLYAMLRAVEAGGQAALMAPTETLAEQHFATLGSLLGGDPVWVSLLTGATPPAERRAAAQRLASAEPCLIVGTHALIEPEVAFGALTLAVIDEQHRFGVRQRAELEAKGPGELAPHALHMTATPIPRTLSLTAYGDLDVTALRELPRGRQPIGTKVVSEEERPGAYEFLRARLREGRQAYVVCPLVSESHALEAKAAEAEAKRLAAGELRDFRVGVLHGQMPTAQKADAMSRFASGETDVLVATSVIEVGIDVSNATVMVVEGAERYGLSQLHQLRGRVGRGELQSACLLFGDPESDAARARLAAIESEGDGFKLAEVDLGIRGEGELLGTRQHGLPRFRAAVLPDDLSLLLEARAAVRAQLDRHGSLEDPALGPLMDEARRRFGDERVERMSA